MPIAPAHDKRFETFNNFPVNASDNKPVRQVDFDLQQKRDYRMYANYNCGESLYEHA